MKEKLRKKLTEAMTARGLTANKVARLICGGESELKYATTRVRIYQFLRGKNTLGIETLERIFSALGLTLKIEVYGTETIQRQDQPKD